MDREHDQDVVARGLGEHTPVEQRGSSEASAAPDAVGIRQPPLFEVTTPNGRVWFVINLN